MKESTVKKYTDILLAAKKSGKNLLKFCSESGLNYNSLKSTIHNLKKNGEHQELLSLYNAVIEKNIEDRVETNIIRDENNKIIKYQLISYRKNKVPFEATLERSEMESICGLYTYYGGNITARLVANEFPKYTLAEIKRILQAFGITKDSFWTPQHLLEELSIEELSQYRINLKEKSAFKYADSQSEKDYTNLIKKLAKENLNLKRSISDKQTFIQETIPSQDYYISRQELHDDRVIVLTLSDLHIGAYNTPYGFVDLDEYNEEEIKNRLKKVLDFVHYNEYTRIIVLNLGDSVDSYKKETTRGGHLLPGSISDKDMSKMYISIMTWFFNSLKQETSDISYVCIGEANHCGDWGWLNNIALAKILESTLNIECKISDYPIDVVNIEDTSIIMTHGKNNYTQSRPFPLILNDKTITWFNDWFLTTNMPLKQNKIVVKGDLHQFAISCCKTFKYVSMPSLYGSSQYIVANFGKTNWGVGYIEYQNGKCKFGTIDE